MTHDDSSLALAHDVAYSDGSHALLLWYAALRYLPFT